MRSVVVVGASTAGWSVARGLRRRGFDGDVTLVGAEPHLPYDRPPLSKAYLAGTADAASLSLLAPGDAESVTWRLGARAVALGVHGPDRTIVLADGAELSADAVVVATGATPHILPGVGALAGVHTLRTRDDADALRAALLPAARIVVVGAGFIGAEVASTAHTLGADVALVDAVARPMADAFGELAAVVTGLHAAAGVALHTGAAVSELLSAGGRVTGVALVDGRTLPADVVVVGIGVRPEAGWLDGSGVAREDGVVVDPAGRTSVPGVWACGDVARYPSARAGAYVRVEHWTHARDSGDAVAGALVGEPATYDPVPYVWSEQYGVMIQLAGFPRAGDAVDVVEGDPTAHRFVAAYARDGHPVAVLAMNSPRTFTRLRKQL